MQREDSSSVRYLLSMYNSPPPPKVKRKEDIAPYVNVSGYVAIWNPLKSVSYFCLFSS